MTAVAAVPPVSLMFAAFLGSKECVRIGGPGAVSRGEVHCCQKFEAVRSLKALDQSQQRRQTILIVTMAAQDSIGRCSSLRTATHRMTSSGSSP